METYLIVIGKTSTGYSAHCPDVDGCPSVGDTVEEVVANMKSAMEFHFEGLADDGDAIPTSSGAATYRQVMQESDADQYLLAHVQVDTSQFTSAVGQP